MDQIPNNIHYVHNSCFICEICHRNLSNCVYYSPNTHDEDAQKFTIQCKKCHEASTSICSVCFTYISSIDNSS